MFPTPLYAGRAMNSNRHGFHRFVKTALVAVAAWSLAAEPAHAQFFGESSSDGVSGVDSLSIADINLLRDFAGVPGGASVDSLLAVLNRTQYGHMLAREYAETNLVLFIGVRGADRFVYLPRGNRGDDPFGQTLENGQDLVVFWIAEQNNRFTKHIKVEFERAGRVFRDASKETQSASAAYSIDSTSTTVELGLRRFRLPIRDLLSSTVSFVQRDVESYELRTWERTYYIDNSINNLLTVGFYAPILSRTGVLGLNDVSDIPDISLTTAIDFFRLSGVNRRVGGEGAVERVLFPRLVLGLGLRGFMDGREPVTFYSGLAWPVMGEILDICFGVTVIAVERERTYPTLFSAGVIVNFAGLLDINRF